MPASLWKVMAAAGVVAACSGVAHAAPYQKYLNGSCGQLVCSINFPVVPVGNRLEISNVSCYLRTQSDSGLYAAQLLVVAGANFPSAVTLVPYLVDTVGATPSAQIWSANHSIFAFATAGQKFRAYVELLHGNIYQWACHISGQMVPS